MTHESWNNVVQNYGQCSLSKLVTNKTGIFLQSLEYANRPIEHDKHRISSDSKQTNRQTDRQSRKCLCQNSSVIRHRDQAPCIKS